jgi:hypothetical protein
MRMDWEMLGPTARIPGDSQVMQQRTMSRRANQCARAFSEEDATPAGRSYCSSPHTWRHNWRFFPFDYAQGQDGKAKRVKLF